MKNSLKVLLLMIVSILLCYGNPDEEFSHRGHTYEITFSKYTPGYEAKREKALGGWIDRQASQRQIDEMSKLRKYAIITEVKDQHYKRRIFANRKGSVAVRTGRTYSQFAEYHKEYFSKGYQLLSLTYFVDQFNKKWYNATWVNHKDYEEFAKDLDLYGITRAKVEIFDN